MYDNQKIRKLREEFWTQKNHKYLPEAKLLTPPEDKTTLFNQSGMQQLIPYLMGKPHHLGDKLFNIQKCIRTNDIDEVGDNRHLTMFEMMGNRSLGSYFKKEAIQRSFEFLTKILKIPVENLAVTVFEGNGELPKDEETLNIRQSLGIKTNRIGFSQEDNRRSPGEIGPCGPDTEIFYYIGKQPIPANSNPINDENNRLEIRNNVFMEFYRGRKTFILFLNNFSKEELEFLEKNIKNFLNNFENKFYLIGKKYFSHPKVEFVEKINKDFFNKFLDPENELFFIKKANAKADFNSKNINFHEIKNLNKLSQLLEKNRLYLINLKQKNVDTGMGLERLLMVLNNLPTVFETDLFSEIIKTVENNFNTKYSIKKENIRIIVDHLKASSFIINDGGIPSNTGAGYILRMLIRRAFYNILVLQNFDTNISQIDNFLQEFLSKLQKNYSHQKLKINKIKNYILEEINLFSKTIFDGKKKLETYISKQNSKTIDGEFAFKLYDTFGFPIKLTIQIAQQNGFKVEINKFEELLKQAKEISKQATKEKFDRGIDRSKYLKGIPKTEFIGYDNLKLNDKEANIKILKDFIVNGKRVIIFNKSPFYAESGGQTGDKGEIILDDGTKLKIIDVKKYEGVFLHFVE